MVGPPRNTDRSVSQNAANASKCAIENRPSVNRAGEFIGIIFDGNLASLSGDFGYEDKQARALSVDSAGILEALRKVYEVPALVNELVNGKR